MEQSTTVGQIFEGVVVKSAMKDTVTVAVSRYVKHPKYKKYQKKTKKFLVHNPGNSVAIGDKVSIRHTRPISKRKHFVIESVLSAAPQE
ncbi:MAG TPA: 30S ribosomal protein S17 [Candidatus Paceibacterota bacterium]|nr:30S ribosomal protein S17 [Candidatus Paceibacterota bacterium]